MATQEKDAFLIYFPVGGSVSLNLPVESGFEGSWFDPQTGKMKKVSRTVRKQKVRFQAPDEEDWVLILERGSIDRRDRMRVPDRILD